MFKVLGVDPGLTRFGYGLVGKASALPLNRLDSGVFMTDKHAPEQERLHQIGQQFARLLDTLKPDEIALERIFAQANLHSVMSIAQISGIVNYEAANRKIPVVLFTPTQVKAQVTGYGKADKQQVATMVAKVLKMETQKMLADESDALALALCHHLVGNRLLTSQQRVEDNQNRMAKVDTLTPAQRVWLEAERQSRKSK